MYSNKHPLVELVFYICMLIMASLQTHPLGLAVLYLFLMYKKSICIKVDIVIVLITMLINALTNHRGVTYLFYINGNIITLESIIYGAILGFQIVVLTRLLIYISSRMTSDKILIATSHLDKNLSLVISLGLRSVIRHKRKLGELYSLHKSMADTSFLQQIFVVINTLIVLVNWSLENSLEISQSMTLRGYGSGRRTSYSPVVLLPRDYVEIVAIIGVFALWIASRPRVIIQPMVDIGFDILHTTCLVGGIYEGYIIDKCRQA